MATIPAAQQTKAHSPPLPRGLVAVATGLVLFAFIMGAFVVGYQIAYAGRIFPGVSVMGIDLSGMNQDQAAATLHQRLSYAQNGRIVFQDKDDIWIVAPGEVGLQVDAQNTALAAYIVGRQGDPISRLYAQFDAWYSGVDYPALLFYDEHIARAYLEEIGERVNRPTVEATIEVVGADVVSQTGQIGRSLDIPASLAPLEAQLRSMSDGMIPLEIIETPPQILDASVVAETARQILNRPMTLQVPNPEEGDPGPWTFSEEKLAEMMAFAKVETEDNVQYHIVMDANELRTFLENQSLVLARFPSNARFIFNDETRELEVLRSATIGRALDVEGTIEIINQKLVEGETNIPLKIDYLQPDVGVNATAASLGITELVSVHTSFFRGSSGSRIQNIQTAAGEFHGLLVPPGATFSMADNMRDVSLDNGYAEALIIYGGRTIEGVGGGVCQVSTTLFRTAFFGGYPINERHPHAYRVGYYEQTKSGWDDDLAGLDATVYVPVVDFQFTNNTPNWLLMETYVNPSNGKLTWKFYSTSEGRSVEWNSSGPQNIVDAPKPRYEENPDLAKGQIKQVDWEAEGADVTVTRIVYKDGQVLFEDSFSTHYEPWQAVYQYGPGTKLPKNR